MKKNIAILSLFACLFTAPGFGAPYASQPNGTPKAPKKAVVFQKKAADNTAKQLKIEVKLERGGKITVYNLFGLSGTQSNYSVLKIGTPEQENSAINMMPVITESSIVDYQLAVEFNDKDGRFMYQVEKLVALDKESVVVDTPDARLTVKFTIDPV